jgi:CO/xanthine dehydrogenase Mo-binding subunit
MNEHRVVGRSLPRLDGMAKVTGAARYAIDLAVPGMLHAHVVRSQRAHARLVGIATGEAAAVPGVVRVVTAADLEGLVPYYGHVVLDHPILAIERTLFHGEPVALVVAESRAAAAEAADLVEVEYEDLPDVTDPLEALEEGAPVLHPVRGERVGDEGFDAGAPELTGNLCAVCELGWGDLEAAFAGADHVVEGEFRYPMLYGYAMEPYNALARFEQGTLTIHTTAQHPYQVRKDLARVFGLPLARVRVVVPYVGGGYGSKSYTKVEPLAAVASWLTGRPVKLALSVEEAILTTRSDSAVVRARSAFAADGRLLGRDFDMVLDSGAYTDNSPQVAQKAANRCFGPYRPPALRVRVRAVFTNTVPASSLRGFGAPQGTLAGETQMDEAAALLGLDPVALRLRNLAVPGGAVLPGRRGLDADLGADLDLLAEALGPPRPAPDRAVGLALTASDAGAYPVSTAMVRIHGDGSASALTGATELGQGSQTVIAQIVAEELGIPFERVTVVSSDTGVTPYERTTGASRTTTIAGRALMEACRDARRRIRELAASVLGLDPTLVADGPAGVLAGGRVLSYGEVITRWFGAEGEVTGTGAIRKADDFAAMPPFWEIGCGGVVAAIDRETGVVTVEKLVTVGDVGFAVNPALVHGQDAGAAMMGLGAALREELVYEGGMPANPNLVDYRVPRFSDLPAEMEQLLVERRDGVGPYGAKGAGEGALNPMGAAVAAAIGRLTGRFPRRLPASPERVWELLRDQERSSIHDAMASTDTAVPRGGHVGGRDATGSNR